jgi:hypothetical protein
MHIPYSTRQSAGAHVEIDGARTRGPSELFLFERAIHVGIGEDGRCTYNAAGPRFLNVLSQDSLASRR